MAAKEDSHSKTTHYAFSPNSLSAPNPVTVADGYVEESTDKAVA
jgi:hypothetical protein